MNSQKTSTILPEQATNARKLCRKSASKALAPDPELTAASTVAPAVIHEATAYVHNVRAMWERIVQAQQDVLKSTTLAELVQQGLGLQYVI